MLLIISVGIIGTSAHVTGALDVLRWMLLLLLLLMWMMMLLLSSFVIIIVIDYIAIWGYPYLSVCGMLRL